MQTSFKLGLTGFPLGSSLSPAVHSAALKACGLEGEYSLFPIHPGDMQGLKNLLARLRSREMDGLNVTIPHKQNIIPLLDDLTATARAIGAVNTIYHLDGRLIGGNTDAPAFGIDLNSFIGRRESESGIRHSALVLGAGGSARAVVYALLNDGWDITLFARRLEQAQELASSFSDHRIKAAAFGKFQCAAFDLLVNTTPVGMTPDIHRSPWPENIPFPAACVYDLVYQPRRTKLVRDALAQGLHATAGLGMLVEQAALAFEIWTGRHPSRNILFAAVDR